MASNCGPSRTPADVASVKGHQNRCAAGSWALLLLRLVVGYGFLAHGLAKLSRGPVAFAGTLDNLGVPLPMLSAWLTIWVEILGGTTILPGLFVVWSPQ
jgi:putative oxidoreductase